MSSTNKTANLGLPQWEASDPVERADFNDSFSIIDGNIGRKKLLDYKVTSETSSVSLNLSSIDKEPFAELQLYFDFGNSLYMQVNGRTDAKYNFVHHGGSRETQERMSMETSVIRIVITKHKFFIKAETVYSHYYLNRSDFADINSIKLYYDGNTRFQPGDRITIWGVYR